MIDSTRWVSIWLLFFCGCTLGLHIGKLPAALPLLTQAFSLRLSEAGQLVAMFSFLIALSGLFIGVMVARFGYALFATAGLAIAGLSSIAGVNSSSAMQLIISRAFEGFGWIVAVVAIPALMTNLAKPADRPVVLGIWGAFFPAGAGVMLLLAPYLQEMGGWRLSWWVSAGASLCASAIILSISLRQRDSFRPLNAGQTSHFMNELKFRSAWGLFFCFLFYSFQFVSLTAFLPTLFIEELGLSLASASRWTALIILSNIIGNMGSGQLIRRGFPVHHLLVVASLVMGVSALITLSAFPAPIRVASAFAFACFGGLIPGSLFATAPLVASKPAATGILVGLMLQAAGIGQWSGPLLFTVLVEASGWWWSGGLLLFSAAVVCALAAVFGLRPPARQAKSMALE